MTILGVREQGAESPFAEFQGCRRGICNSCLSAARCAGFGSVSDLVACFKFGTVDAQACPRLSQVIGALVGVIHPEFAGYRFAASCAFIASMTYYLTRKTNITGQPGSQLRRWQNQPMRFAYRFQVQDAWVPRIAFVPLLHNNITTLISQQRMTTNTNINKNLWVALRDTTTSSPWTSKILVLSHDPAAWKLSHCRRF